jgi:hypothetical protein
VLGFAHEEEFAIVALCAGRANCWSVMAVYAVAVAGVILALTLVSARHLIDFVSSWIAGVTTCLGSAR